MSFQVSFTNITKFSFTELIVFVVNVSSRIKINQKTLGLFLYFKSTNTYYVISDATDMWTVAGIKACSWYKAVQV